MVSESSQLAHYDVRWYDLDMQRDAAQLPGQLFLFH